MEAAPPEPQPPQAPAAPLAPAAFAEGRRLHVLTLVQRFLKSLPAMVLALLPLMLRSSGSSDRLGLMLLGGYAVLALPAIVVQYLRFQYWITPREIVIHSGVLTRRKRNIPIERIQSIEIERSLLPRLLGTAKVKIETAGSTAAEGVLEYVSVAEAEAIRQVVRRYQRSQAPAPEAPIPEAVPAAEVEEPPLFTMPLRRVLLSGVFRFSLLYIALIFSALQYLLDLLGLDPDELARRIARMLRAGLPPYAEVVQASPWVFGLAVALSAALLGWLTGIAINLNKYYGFRLWRSEDRLHKRYGLLTVAEGTIPLKRVQALLLRSNPLMRRFGWFRLELQTMGYDVQQQGHQVAVPFAQLADILALAPSIRPFTLPAAFTSVSRVTIRRHFVRYTVLWLALVLPVAYFFPVALWALAALPLWLVVAVLHWRMHGYAFAGGLLYVRRGIIRQRLWILPVDKFQAFWGGATYFQRRLGLATVYVDTAGASTFAAPEIEDVEAETGEALLAALNQEFQGYFGGTGNGSQETGLSAPTPQLPSPDAQRPPSAGPRA